eukprot:759911-Hanusia_phi.AAC.2
MANSPRWRSDKLCKTIRQPGQGNVDRGAIFSAIELCSLSLFNVLQLKGAGVQESQVFGMGGKDGQAQAASAVFTKRLPELSQVSFQASFALPVIARTMLNILPTPDRKMLFWIENSSASGERGGGSEVKDLRSFSKVRDRWSGDGGCEVGGERDTVVLLVYELRALALACLLACSCGRQAGTRMGLWGDFADLRHPLRFQKTSFHNDYIPDSPSRSPGFIIK